MPLPRFTRYLLCLLIFQIHQQYSQAQSRTPDPAPASEIKLNVSAKGTGRTTGHIADIVVSHKNDFSLNILPQIFFIPSEGSYQSYVGRIPDGITIPPRGTAVIPVNGVCADIRTPPVPDGGNMPPVSTWVPVGIPSGPTTSPDTSPMPDPTQPPGELAPPTGDVPVYIIPGDPVPDFTPSHIPDIVAHPDFRTTPRDDDPGTIIITWPGTNVPIDGIFRTNTDPNILAPVLVRALEVLEESYEVLVEDGRIHTPFSGHGSLQQESVIQQTFWIFTSGLTGHRYTRDDFEDKVYEQYTSSTGTTIKSIPADEKRQLDDGIGDFWNTFTAVGVEAKILGDPARGIPADDGSGPVLIQDGGGKITIHDNLSRTERFNKPLKECFLDKFSYRVMIEHVNTRGSGRQKTTKRDMPVVNDKNEAVINVQKGDSILINIMDLTAQCQCWDEQKPSGEKSGPHCPSEITAISLQSFPKALTDHFESIIEKAVLDSLRKEIQKKIEEMEAQGATEREKKKLKDQLDDEKKLKKENKTRITALTDAMSGRIRLNHPHSHATFVAGSSMKGILTFVFQVKGVCKGDDPCKSSVFVKTITITIQSK